MHCIFWTAKIMNFSAITNLRHNQHQSFIDTFFCPDCNAMLFPQVGHRGDLPTSVDQDFETNEDFLKKAHHVLLEASEACLTTLDTFVVHCSNAVPCINASRQVFMSIRSPPPLSEYELVLNISMWYGLKIGPLTPLFPGRLRYAKTEWKCP